MKANFKPAKDVSLDTSIGVNVNFQQIGDIVYGTIMEPDMPNRTVMKELVGTQVEKDTQMSKFLRATASSVKFSSKYFRELKAKANAG